MPEPIRGADALVRALLAAGTRTLFSLSGNHIMPVYDALLGSGIGLIHTRHEAAAVHMADAWGRLTGEAGIALVTGGQGHTNAVAGLSTALAGEVPLVLLSGHAPLAEIGMGAFQELDNAALAAPVAKAAWAAQSTAGLAGDLARAIRIARSGRPGPVHLSLPTDVIEAKIDPGAIAWPDAAAFAPVPMPLPPRLAVAVLAEIGAAARPVVIAPPALCSPRGAALLATLRGALGIPVIPMESPRGINDPAHGALAEVLAEADLVVLLGKQLDFTLRFGKAAPTARWVVLEPDPALLDRARRGLGERLVLGALCGPSEAAAALAEAGRGAAGPQAGWTVSAEAALAHRPAAWGPLRVAADPIHPVALCAALEPLLAHPDAILVCDGGEIGQWAQSLLRAPTRLINGVAGAIGAALPFALAARAARPEAPILALMGDGTFGFHMAEFDTACRHNLPFVCVVGNDAKWNAEYQIQRRDYGAQRTHGCELAPGTRYDLVAAALGGHGEFVERAADLPAALERAVASGRPACVNVLIAGQPAPQVKRAS